MCSRFLHDEFYFFLWEPGIVHDTLCCFVFNEFGFHRFFFKLGYIHIKGKYYGEKCLYNFAVRYMHGLFQYANIFHSNHHCILMTDLDR